MELADRFRAAQLALCDRLAAETRYDPTKFRRDVEPKDGDETVAYTRRLIIDRPGPEGTYGFRRMIEIKREKDTIEYQVCRPEWRDLFPGADGRAVRDVARFRLAWHGVTAPPE